LNDFASGSGKKIRRGICLGKLAAMMEHTNKKGIILMGRGDPAGRRLRVRFFPASIRLAEPPLDV
jgi:hypothetical protein